MATEVSADREEMRRRLLALRERQALTLEHVIAELLAPYGFEKVVGVDKKCAGSG